MLTSKQRAYLRGLAAAEDTIVIIGKGGITENIIIQMNDALKARELVKGRVLENSLLTAREAADALSETCRAEIVQVIGSKFVLYKRNEQKPKIELPKAKKKGDSASTAGASTRPMSAMPPPSAPRSARRTSTRCA